MWGCGERRRERGLQLLGIPPCFGSVGRRGGDRGGGLVKALLMVAHNLPQRTQIDHRVSVVFPDDGERLTFGGARGVWRRRSGHRL